MSATTLSFVIGFVLGIITTLLFQRVRPLIQQIRQNTQVQQEEAKIRKTSGLEDNLRRLTLRRAQGMHLAAQLFPLNDVLQEPRLLAPPMPVMPGVLPPQEDIVAQTLPYLPDWPELAALFRSPTLTVDEAIGGGRNIVLVGEAGTGKTVALAHLASMAANLKIRMDSGRDAVPLYYHVADLQLPYDTSKDALTVVLNAAADKAPAFDQRRLPEFINLAIKNGSALLLIDGFDEVEQGTQSYIIEWLSSLIEAFPNLRIVTTGNAHQLNGLVSLGFSPLAVVPWAERDCTNFLRQWSIAWMESVGEAGTSVDPLLLNEWLEMDNMGLSPLEMTLKTWSAYAGDSLGSSVLDFIRTHIRRLAPSGTPIAALEQLAMQVVLNSQPIFDPKRARSWVKEYDTAEEGSLELNEFDSPDTTGEDNNSENETRRSKKSKSKVSVPSYGLLSKLVDSGLLVLYGNERVRFLHPILNGYLAGQAISDNNVQGNLVALPDYDGKFVALRYLAARANASSAADTLLKGSDLPLYRGTFIVARWLKDAPKQAPWRAKVFASLLTILQADGQPTTLRAQAMAAFATSGDPGAAILFRQMLASRSFELIPLAAFGCGAMKDKKSVAMLEDVLQAPVSAVRRAACLALVAIGSEASMEAVARALLQGDDELRRAAAQALANNTKDGYEILREGISMEDIMLRRAIVHGLARVEEPWALELLQQMQVEDEQWAVRNLANQYVDELSVPDPRIPTKLAHPSETPWLVEFAGKLGMGIPREGYATDVLLNVYRSGTTEQKLAVIPYLIQSGEEGVIGSLYGGVYGEDPEVREASFLAIQDLASDGVNVPHPNQFGAG